MFRTFAAALIASSVAAGVTPDAIAQQATQQTIWQPSAQYVNTYIEVLPDAPQSGEQALTRFVAYARSQPGAVSIDLIHEIGLSYRYAIRQVWSSPAAYTTFENSQSTQAWTNYLTSYLAAPFDNRLGSLVD